MRANTQRIDRTCSISTIYSYVPESPAFPRLFLVSSGAKSILKGSNDALITVPQPPGLYGPLLYPSSTTGTAGLTLDFTVAHPVGRRGTEYTCEENALHRAYRAEVTTGSCLWSPPHPELSTPRH
jgi:hypothetical protein